MSSLYTSLTVLAGAVSLAMAALFLYHGVYLDDGGSTGATQFSCTNSSIEFENVNGTVYLYQEEGQEPIGEVKVNLFSMTEGTSSTRLEIDSAGQRYAVANSSDIMDATAESSRCPGKTAIINP